jgi:hypothetical protein
MEVHASPFAESSDAAALRGFIEKGSNTADLAQEVFDSLEGIVRVYDNKENFTTPAVAARNALVRAEGRLINAQERYGAALDAHS